MEPNFRKPVIVYKLLGLGASSSVFAAQYEGSNIHFCAIFLLISVLL